LVEPVPSALVVSTPAADLSITDISDVELIGKVYVKAVVDELPLKLFVTFVLDMVIIYFLKFVGR
jgi:hypothetical protein